MYDFITGHIYNKNQKLEKNFVDGNSFLHK